MVDEAAIDRSIEGLRRSLTEGCRIRVAGRVRPTGEGIEISDWSGALPLDLPPPVPALPPWILARLEGIWRDGRLRILAWESWTGPPMPGGEPPSGSPEPSLRELASRGGPERAALDHEAARRIRLRGRLCRRARRYLEGLGSEEVEVPSLVAEPGTDPHIALFTTRYAPMAGAGEPAELYLHTSPELAMKRLLVAGAKVVHRIGPVFRNGECSPAHRPEFLMAEWYRVGADLERLMDETEGLLRALFDEARDLGFVPPALPAVFLRTTVREVFLDSVGVDPLAHAGGPGLARALEAAGLGPFGPEPPYEEVFHQALVERVDAHIASLGPCFLTRYPAPLALLSRLDPAAPEVALRVECYVDGLELSNGFEELTDPAEQRRRFEADRFARRELGRPVPPVPEDFLLALRAGMPPCAGVAVGLDRVIQLACGAEGIHQAIPMLVPPPKH